MFRAKHYFIVISLFMEYMVVLTNITYYIMLLYMRTVKAAIIEPVRTCDSLVLNVYPV